MGNKTKESESGIIGRFSVALGLFDYINPILYGITVVSIMINMQKNMNVSTFALFVFGSVMSLIFGLSIPTVKLLIGIGKMQFKLPVCLVFFVNIGILFSGIALSTFAITIKPLLAILILVLLFTIVGLLWYRTKKFNTVAVLIGMIGYLLIYISMITFSIRSEVIIPIILYAFAICIFIFLSFIGIFANLHNAKVHWVIEISNVICQFSVALATVTLLFR